MHLTSTFKLSPFGGNRLLTAAQGRCVPPVVLYVLAAGPLEYVLVRALTDSDEAWMVQKEQPDQKWHLEINTLKEETVKETFMRSM